MGRVQKEGIEFGFGTFVRGIGGKFNAGRDFFVERIGNATVGIPKAVASVGHGETTTERLGDGLEGATGSLESVLFNHFFTGETERNDTGGSAAIEFVGEGLRVDRWWKGSNSE
jgi:hypothetical protein